MPHSKNKFILPLISSIQRRIVAVLIDYTLFAIFHTLLLLQFGKKSIAEDGRPIYELEGWLNALPVIIWILTFPFMESFEGMTLGKKILSLRVVKINGEPYGMVDAFKRRICDWIDFALLGLPAIIISNNTSYRQRLGDLWAGTCVIRVYPAEDSTGESNNL